MPAHCPLVHADHVCTIFITTAYHDAHIAHVFPIGHNKFINDGSRAPFGS